MIRRSRRVTNSLLVFAAVVFSAAIPMVIVDGVAISFGVPVAVVFELSWHVYLIAVVIAVLFGLPVMILLASFGVANWCSSLLSGATIGFALAIFFEFPNPNYVICALLALIGAVSGLLFYQFWRVRIPGAAKENPAQPVKNGVPRVV